MIDMEKEIICIFLIHERNIDNLFVTQKGHIRTKVILFKKSYTRIGITNNSIQSNKRTFASQTYNMFDEEEGGKQYFSHFLSQFFLSFCQHFLKYSY